MSDTDSNGASESDLNVDTNPFNASGVFSDNNLAFVEKLDELQMQVEELRNSASRMEEQRNTLTKSLTDLAETSGSSALTEGHREEIQTNINSLMQRLLTVYIKVEIPRTHEQLAAYKKVKTLLDELQSKINSGLEDYKNMLNSYLNACSSERVGPVHSTFQQAMLACTIDDQKQVKKILNNWVEGFRELHHKWIESCKENMSKLA